MHPLLLRGTCPLLVMMEALWEVCEKSVNPDLVYPECVFFIRVLAEVEVQIQILIPESVWMYLINSTATKLKQIMGPTLSNLRDHDPFLDKYKTYKAT